MHHLKVQSNFLQYLQDYCKNEYKNIKENKHNNNILLIFKPVHAFLQLNNNKKKKEKI